MKVRQMIAAGNDREICDVSQSVAFCNKTFAVIEEFVYFGSSLTSNNYESIKIQKKIQPLVT
jgi:hypothetical protein